MYLLKSIIALINVNFAYRAQVAFKAICLVNGLVGFVNIFYPPVPHISQETIKSAEKAVGKLSEKSSVEEFAVLQRVLDDKKVKKGESVNCSRDYNN